MAIATGRLAYPYISEMAEKMMGLWQGLTVHVYAIRNDFFGEHITFRAVTAQVCCTAKGITAGKKAAFAGKYPAQRETVFLDDITVAELEKALQVPVNIVKSSGCDFVETILRNRD